MKIGVLLDPGGRAWSIVRPAEIEQNPMPVPRHEPPPGRDSIREYSSGSGAVRDLGLALQTIRLSEPGEGTFSSQVVGLPYGVKPNGGKTVPSLGTRPRCNPACGLPAFGRHSPGSYVSMDHNEQHVLLQDNMEASHQWIDGPGQFPWHDGRLPFRPMLSWWYEEYCTLLRDPSTRRWLLVLQHELQRS